MHVAEATEVQDGLVGHRVAVARKLVGLTRQQLANRAHVSRSLIEKVERGVVPATAAFVAVTARVLGADVAELTGQAHVPPVTDPRADHAGIPALRTALVCAPAPDGGLLPADELRTRLAECARYATRSRYVQLLAVLPELLAHARVLAESARAGHHAENAWALLDDAYACGHVVTYRFGYLDLAALISGLRRETCERASDPLRTAASVTERVHLGLRCGDHPAVHRMIEQARTGIDDQHGPAADAVRTQLHLLQALTHARGGTGDRADEHLTAARELVDRGVPAHPYHGVRASTANVEIHRVRVPVELRDGATAVHRATALRLPETTEPTRAGPHWITVARAWTLHGDRAKTLSALTQARSISPQLTRYHSHVHETVYQLAETDHRTTASLAGFARWLGLTL